MTTEKVVVWGAGGHAKVVAGILRLNGFEVHSFVDEINFDRRSSNFCGTQVVSNLSGFIAVGPPQGGAIVAIGDNVRRLHLIEQLQDDGFSIVTAVHPSAVVSSDAQIGAGSVIAAACVVGPAVAIGRGAIVNTRAGVDHDCVVGDGAHVGPGATLGGAVTVGTCAWIGIGATVSDHIRIGDRSIVGAGSVVIADVPDDVTVVGAPARVLRHSGVVNSPPNV